MHCENFVVARLDTKNGKAPLTSALDIRRNRNYILMLKPDGKVIERVEKPQSLEEILAFLVKHSGEPGPHPALESDLSVQIRMPRLWKLNEKSQKKIAAQVIRLLKTSEFNSARQPNRFQGGLTRTQAYYRKTASVSHLVLSFKKPQKFRTIGGEIEAAEVVIGLSHKSHHSSLFTVDAKGVVVEHAKESLDVGTALLNEIRAATDRMIDLELRKLRSP